MSNTVTHTTALKLKEAGWEKETERYWVGAVRRPLCKAEIPKTAKPEWMTPAPTFAEIWADLPDTVGRFVHLELTKVSVHYLDTNLSELKHKFMLCDFPNITEAAAALWLELRKEGVI